MAAGEDQLQPLVRERPSPPPRPRRLRATSSSRVLAASVRSLRIRSIARFRAVVVSQAPGLAGSPSRGQRSAAIANASWVASSARSKSPRKPIRLARTRPHSSRKTCSSSATAPPAVAPRPRHPVAPPESARQARAPRRGSRPRRAGAAEHLLRVRERPVGDAVASPSFTRTVVALSGGCSCSAPRTSGSRRSARYSPTIDSRSSADMRSSSSVARTG